MLIRRMKMILLWTKELFTMRMKTTLIGLRMPKRTPIPSRSDQNQNVAPVSIWNNAIAQHNLIDWLWPKISQSDESGCHLFRNGYELVLKPFPQLYPSATPSTTIWSNLWWFNCDSSLLSMLKSPYINDLNPKSNWFQFVSHTMLFF